MSCPLYTNKEIFDGFNQIVEAFGGKALTEEEFRSSELRNQREGLDLSAMNTAYALYDLNGGYTLDKAKNGEPSILFQYLLKANDGDILAAIRDKSEYYAKDYISQYGNWLANVNEFDLRSIDTTKVDVEIVQQQDLHEGNETLRIYLKNQHEKGFFELVKDREYGQYSVHFKTAKEGAKYNKDGVQFSTKEDRRLLFQQLATAIPPGATVSTWGTLSDEGVVGVNNVGRNMVKVGDREVHLKSDGSAINIPIFQKNAIYNTDKNGEPVVQQETQFGEINEELGILHQLTQSNSQTNLGPDILSGKTVSSKNIVSNLLSAGAVSITNTELANILLQHDIPTRLGNLESNVVATTITDENGGSIIIINSDLVDVVGSERIADSVLHEIIHALTVPAIDNPVNRADKVLQKTNRRIYSVFSKLAKKYSVYEPIFNNEKEFISIFTTDKLQRQVVYDIAKQSDRQQKNTIKQHIKDFVNAISEKILNNKVFLTNEQKLNTYKQTIKDYLYNKQPIYKGNLTNKQLFDAVYNNFDIDVANLNKYTDGANHSKSLLSTIQRNNADISDNKSKIFFNVAQILNTRLKSIRKRSAQDDVVIKQQQSIKYQIDLITRVSYAEKIIGFQTIAQNLEPQIAEDLKTIEKVENGERTFTSEDYQVLRHQDVSTYIKVANDILQILSDTEQLDEFVNAAYDVLPNKKDITTPEGAVDYNKFRHRYIDETIKPLIAVFNNISAESNKASERLQILNRKMTRNTLKDIFDAVKNPNSEEYLQKLIEIETDAGTFISQIRPMDYEQDDALRSLGYLVRKANRMADSDTYETIIPLLEALDKLNKDLSLEDFYEKNGKITTGYLVREFNFGKFYDDYADEMARINSVINKKYNLNLLPTNRTAPDQDDARREFNDLRNTWLEKNCHRRFINAYYRAQSDLPTEAVRQMRSINRQLFQINNLKGVTDPKTGYPDYYKLTPEQWDALQEILVRKKMLRSDYDEWGNLKSPEELRIARAIQNYYEVLYKNNNGGFKKDRKAWVNARVKFLESLGAFGYYNESTDTFNEKGIREFMKNNNFAKKQWDLWNTRNSVHQFKQNQDNEALVFKQIENEMGSTKPYYGSKDEEYTKKINDLLNVYHGTNGHVYDQMMSIELIKKLSNLMRKQYQYRHRAQQRNPKLKAQAKLYSEILHKYITFEKTERYKQLEEEALKQAMKFGSDDYLLYFLNIMKQYGSVAYVGDIPRDIRPFRWFTNIKAIDEDVWMEWVPGDSFSDIENSISYKNDEFKEEYGVSYIPKGKTYDNSKQYNKIKNTQLYKEILTVMRQSYSNMENRSHADPYLLPQITGSMFKYMQGRAGYKGKFDGAYDWLKDNIGLNGITQNDSDYGYDENSEIEDNQIDESLEDRMLKIGTLKNTPDGHVMHFVPQFYTKRNRPEYISKDLIGIISTFYNMSSRYKHKMAIKDDCETIVDMLEARTYKKRSGTEREEAVLGKDTGTYKKARKFLDINLYGMRRTKYQIQITPELQWEVTKTVDLLKRYTTANNLGANPKVALVGFLTTFYGHLINSIIGNSYAYDDAAFGALVVGGYIVKNTAFGAATFGYSTDVGKILTDSSLINMMERFNLANQFERKTHHTNMNRLSRVVYENSVFGMLSSADFVAKANVLVSVLHSFRLVDGKFINKDGIYRNAAKISDTNAREKYIIDKLTQYNAKDVITMYDAIDKNAKSFKVKSQHKTAFDDAYYTAQAIAEKLAERADGMATEEQKGMITQNIIGSLVLIHRQYLPLQWIESFAEPVYDMDMETYKGGRFHVMYKYLKELATQSTGKFASIGALLGAYVGLGTTGLIPAALIGTGIGVIGGKLTKKYHQHKSIKQVNKEFFNDTSSEKSMLLSRHRQRVRNQVLAEVAMCKVLQILVSMFCNFMDTPDKKDQKAMQFLALVLRQLEWETYSPYRGDDTLSSLKTASPVTGTSDDIQNGFSLAENYTAYMFSNLTGTGTATSPLGLLNTMFLAPEQDIFRTMRSGPYEGDAYWEKVLYKLTPWSNTYEQYKDSKGKRKYLENQVFKLNK